MLFDDNQLIKAIKAFIFFLRIKEKLSHEEEILVLLS